MANKKMNLPSKYDDLKGKTVFITGGGSGIGASITEAFISQGANVGFVGLGAQSNKAFCDKMEATYGVRPLFEQCDIQDIDHLRKAMDKTRNAYGAIGVLVNNAARDTRHKVDGYTVEEWDEAMHINLRPHFFTAQSVKDEMAQAGGGSIINFSSISYLMGNPGYVSYATAKAGITGLTRVMARELGPHNIRVNALLPGWVMTERQKELWVTPEALAGHLAQQALPDMIQPEDMAAPTLFLASHASRMMTGQMLIVDGGVV